jgi:hypothetical protein
MQLPLNPDPAILALIGAALVLLGRLGRARLC